MGNFTFLKNEWPKLAELGTRAEEYIFSDPEGSLTKLRGFAEITVDEIYSNHKDLPYNEGWALYEKMGSRDFAELVGPALCNKFHKIRLAGNDAVHANSAKSNKVDVMSLLEYAYLIGSWLFTNKFSLQQNPPPFQKPKEADSLTDNHHNKLDLSLNSSAPPPPQENTFSDSKNPESHNSSNELFSINLQYAVSQLLINSPINIADIIHTSNLEKYVFKIDDNLASVDIHYEENLTVSNLTPQPNNNLALTISVVLKSLIGKQFTTAVPQINELTFIEKFLEEFYYNLTSLLSQANIKVSSLEKMSYRLRYVFTRENDSAAFDLIYNGKGQISRIEQKQLSSMSTEIAILIEQAKSL